MHCDANNYLVHTHIHHHGTMILQVQLDNIISTTLSMVDDAAVDDSEDSYICKKNVGEPKRLRRWSRGHRFVVRAGGHIDSWQPLYK